MVGVNGYTEGGDDETPILRIDPALERKQVGRLQAVRAAATGGRRAALSTLREAAAGDANLMGPCSTAPARTPPRARSSGRCSASSAPTPRRPSSRSRVQGGSDARTGGSPTGSAR